MKFIIRNILTYSRYYKYACPCNLTQDNLTADHPHSCIKEKSGAIAYRSKLVTDVICDYARISGLNALVECVVGPEQDRTDIYFTSNNPKSFPHHIDVQITHCRCPSNFATSKGNPEINLQHRADVKQRHYESLCKAQDEYFSPFIVSSFGMFHAKALKLISDIVDFGFSTGAYNIENIHPVEVLNLFVDSILCALHRGNAAIFSKSKKRMEHKIMHSDSMLLY